MNQPTTANGRPAYYSGAVDCVRKCVHAEGVACLFKGATANYARMVPYTILLFVFFEQYKRAYSSLFVGAAPLHSAAPEKKSF